MTVLKPALMLGALLIAEPVAGLAAMPVSSQDMQFATKAAQGGMTEVKLASIALAKSKNPNVTSFANEMLADHTKNNAQLIAIVHAKGMTPPSSVGAANRAVIDRLRSESGSTFDTDYLESQLPAHRKMLALLQSEASDGKDVDFVNFAKQTIPVVEKHIAMDKRDTAALRSSVGMSNH